MSDEREVWERLPDEPLLWFKRFDRFRLMEPTRSIASVFFEEETEKNREKPRSKPNGDWYEQADKWQWIERVAAWDKVQTARMEKLIGAEKDRVLLSGYAAMHRRVARLNTLTEQLLGYVGNNDLVWLPDVKSVGTGPTAERVDLIQFNSALFHEIRAHLADIAAELGDRVKKKEILHKELPANIYGFDPDQDGTEDVESEEDEPAP